MENIGELIKTIYGKMGLRFRVHFLNLEKDIIEEKEMSLTELNLYLMNNPNVEIDLWDGDKNTT